MKFMEARFAQRPHSASSPHLGGQNGQFFKLKRAFKDRLGLDHYSQETNA